jgi:mRNA interferase MazF
MAPDTRGETLHLPGGHSTLLPDREQSAPIVRGALKSAPRIRNIYWCQFPRDMRQPEFWKTRPVVIISHKNLLTGPILVVPMTTKPQHGDKWAVRLEKNPNPKQTCDVWVVCNHLYTVGCSRLSQFGGSVPRLTPAEFRPIHELVLKWVPRLVSLDSGE